MPPAESSRASAWEWIQAVLLAVNLAWTTLCLGGYRPETMAVTTALTGLLLAVHFIGLSQHQRRIHPAGLLLLPFIVYAAGNVLWVTPVPWLGWLDWIGWAQMIAVFWVVLNGVRASGPKRGLFIAMVGVAFVSVLLACFQRFVQPDWLMLGRVQPKQYEGRMSGPFGIPNSLAAFLLLLLPAVGWLGFRRGGSETERTWGRGLTLLLGFGLVLTVSRGGWIALALALMAWPLLAARGSWWAKLRLTVMASVAVVFVGGVVIVAVPTMRERFVVLARDAGEISRPIVWRAAWELFRAEPAWGTGGGSYNVLFERHRPERFRDETQWAHNEYLNTLSDYGAVGFVLFFGAVATIAIRCFARRWEEPGGRADNWVHAPLFARALSVGLVAFALQILVDFHFKIPTLAMTSAAVSALVVGAMWPLKKARGERSPGVRLGFVLVGLGSGVGFSLGILPHYRGEALRYRAREGMVQLADAPPGQAGYRTAILWIRDDLARAVTLAPRNAQAWADLSYATSLAAHIEPERTAPLGLEAEAAADRALAISQVSFEFWVRRGVARDMQGRWLEAGNDFTRATGIAPKNAFAWYYYADHLSRNPREKGMTLAALDFCLRLDPGNSSGLALRQRLAISPPAP